jgi:UDP-N-acetyl-D-mannosaminuronic acid dehydrogenase
LIEKICVIGIGYIGLPTAAVLAKSGYDVVGVDINEKIVNELNKGNITIEEPYLKELVEDVVSKNKLKGRTRPCSADVFIIAVPTPIDQSKKSDMRYVIQSCNSILPYLKTGNLVVLESTSPLGTTDEVIKPILEKNNFIVGEDIYLGYCPERVIPGSILYELENNDRIIGGVNEKSATKIKEIYSSFVKGKMYLTNTKTAEMCKLMENTYRDVNIALANELSMICDKVDINVWDVIKYCNKHPRVNIHNPGPGVGGHCLAVDPWFIVEKTPDKANLIKLSREINDYMPIYTFNKIENILKDISDKKRVTILGITYKANIDDIRESPIINLINILKENDYDVRSYDPNVYEYEGLYNNLLEACKDSDLIILGVNHNSFKNIDFKVLKPILRNSRVLDSRNFLDRNKLINDGFKYYWL